MDLTYKQYLNQRITNIRDKGKLIKNMGNYYGNKRIYMTYINVIKNLLDKLNIEDIKSTYYIK